MLKHLVLLMFLAIGLSASVRWLFDPTRGAGEISYEEFIATVRSGQAPGLYKEMSHSGLQTDFWDREVITLSSYTKHEAKFVVLPANKLAEAEHELRLHHIHCWKAGLTAVPLLEVAIVCILMTPWLLFTTGFLGPWPSLTIGPPWQGRKSP